MGNIVRGGQEVYIYDQKDGRDSRNKPKQTNKKKKEVTSRC